MFPIGSNQFPVSVKCPKCKDKLVPTAIACGDIDSNHFSGHCFPCNAEFVVVVNATVATGDKIFHTDVSVENDSGDFVGDVWALIAEAEPILKRIQALVARGRKVVPTPISPRDIIHTNQGTMTVSEATSFGKNWTYGIVNKNDTPQSPDVPMRQESHMDRDLAPEKSWRDRAIEKPML